MNRKRNIIETLKASAIFVAFAFLIAITGKMDFEAESGIYTVSGTVIDNRIKAQNGETFRTGDFANGTEVTLKVDSDGHILSIKAK